MQQQKAICVILLSILQMDSAALAFDFSCDAFCCGKRKSESHRTFPMKDVWGRFHGILKFQVLTFGVIQLASLISRVDPFRLTKTTPSIAKEVLASLRITSHEPQLSFHANSCVTINWFSSPSNILISAHTPLAHVDVCTSQRQQHAPQPRSAPTSIEASRNDSTNFLFQAKVEYFKIVMLLECKQREHYTRQSQPVDVRDVFCENSKI